MHLLKIEIRPSFLFFVIYFISEYIDNFEELQNHQNTAHKEFFESHEKQFNRKPAEGDVTVF